MHKVVNKIMKKESKPKVKKTSKPSTVKLISYEIKAVIPTGMYANIQPGIIVTAGSLDEAEAVVLPYIDRLFEKYQEDSRDGRVAKFLAKSPNKSSVTATETVVKLSATDGTKEVVSPISEAYMKAKKAIDGATSRGAINVIQAQIEKSVKLAPEDKPKLLELAIIKFNELPINAKETPTS